MSVLKKKNRWYKWIVFCAIVFVTMIYSYHMAIDTYYYDSSYYWSIADPVFENGFHILDFPQTFRGYFLVVIIGIFKRIFYGVWGWRILSSLIVASMFSFFLPYLLTHKMIDSFIKALRFFSSFIVFMLIWGETTQYPLSDIPAASFMFAGVCVLIVLVKSEISLIKTILLGILGGDCPKTWPN